MGTDNNDVYFIYHLPKCAGGTVEKFLENKFENSYIRPERRKSPQIYFSNRTYTLPKNLDISKIRFVSGHFFGDSLIKIFS